jgi:hypothetical protein
VLTTEVFANAVREMPKLSKATAIDFAIGLMRNDFVTWFRGLKNID